MKVIKLFTGLLLVITVVFYLSDCKQETKNTPASNAPIITLRAPASLSLQVDRLNVINVSFSVITNIYTRANLDSVKVFLTNPWGVKTTLFNRAVPSDSSLMYIASTSWTVPDSISYYGKIFTITVYAVDKAHARSTQTIVMTITNLSDINCFSMCLLGAQNNTTYGSFFACDSGKVYPISLADSIQSRIDFCYFYDNITTSNGISLSAIYDSPTVYKYFPTMSSWKVKTRTKFTMVNLGTTNFKADSTFNAIRYSSTLHSFLVTVQDSLVNQLTDNQNGQLRSYVGFITQSGKWGIIKLEQYLPASDPTKSAIKITVFVDK